MPRNLKFILQAACVVLAAVLAWQVVLIALRINPLGHVAIPELPALPPDQAPKPSQPSVALATAPARGRGSSTNTNALTPGSNVVSVLTNTNSTTVALTTNVMPPATNTVPGPQTISTATNVATNLTTLAATNAAPAPIPGAVGTNSTALATTNAAGTNGLKSAPMAAIRGAIPAGIMPGSMQFPMGAAPPPKLPGDVQARVDRIIESEILGPVIHPQPPALVGIAGQFAFLRAPSGQTGMVKEGDELGGMKLLQIGTNRVLVEQNGQKSELMIFSGNGGESLMPKPETSHETNK